MTDESPSGGKREAGVAYKPRPSAYVLLVDAEQQVATVQSPQGWFLPGGGVDAGESYEQAAVREAHEECGFEVAHLRFICEARQFVRSLKYHEFYEKQCRFFSAGLIGQVGQGEADHTTIWLTQDEALRSLTHESHRFAVSTFFSGDT